MDQAQHNGLQRFGVVALVLRQLSHPYQVVDFCYA
jgi:hypothetical protein